MALFQKKPQSSSSAPLYTLGLQKSILVVGLGNIGKKYDLTRHNIGFLCADSLVSSLDLPKWIEKKDLKCSISVGKAGDKRIIVIKPTTLMNLSGEAVQEVMHFYKITNSDTVVVHDEMDIPFGQIRTRIGGSSAGHNGIKSIIQHIGEDFGRVRIGIGSDTSLDSSSYVLSRFNDYERDNLKPLTKEVVAILTEYIYSSTMTSETRSFI